MIKISINQINNQVNEININGHSGYEEFGKDIVCASVSSIAITTVNAILRLDSEALEYTEKDVYLNIKLLKHDKYIDNLILNMIDLLQELETKYKKYIKFN